MHAGVRRRGRAGLGRGPGGGRWLRQGRARAVLRPRRGARRRRRASTLGELAQQVWYPIWDSGSKLDHSVRSLGEMLEAAATDVRVASGLLDVRHVAGDPSLTIRLRTNVLAHWRRDARQRLPELHRPGAQPAPADRRAGAHVGPGPQGGRGRHPRRDRAQEPDRDLAGRHPRGRPRAVPAAAARRTRPAARGGGPGDATGSRPSSGRRSPRRWGCRTTALPSARCASWAAGSPTCPGWSGVVPTTRCAVLPRASRDGPTSSGSHPASRCRRARSCSTAARTPASDPVLLLRAAAEAARRNAVLAPPTAARLVRECPPLPDPWPEEARRELVRLLAAGPGLLAVWETLEETGALYGILPEWERIRLLPHASVIHRFTVDRHVVETCIEASRADPRGVAARRAAWSRRCSTTSARAAWSSTASPASRSRGRSRPGWGSIRTPST